MSRPQSEHTTGAPPGPDRTPTMSGTLRAAAVLLVVEGLALGGLAVFLAVKPAFTPPGSLGVAEALALFTLLGGVGYAGLGPALARGSRWARSPAVVLQLVGLPVGYSLAFQAGQLGYGVPILLLALATLGCLVRAELQAGSGRP